MPVAAQSPHSLLVAVNLNTPGTYLHWSVFWISGANLAVIGAMVVVFFAALLLPFPAGEQLPAEESDLEPRPPLDASDTADAGGPSPGGRSPGGGRSPDGRSPGGRSLTGRLRRLLVRWLPPERLLPETQPSYVASWAYVFGIASLAALAMAIVSGFLIALGGVDWWHTNPAGHFFNSMHLWSVEMFMAFLVIHLWVKFFMAAWRGKRARTWITGMTAFLVSIVECFTGYLSQQNFDSQWIATNGKDAINATGVGGWFNLLDFGQMLLWHVVLIPLALVVIVGVHVLFVRYRSVVHPFPARRGRDALGQPMATSVPALSRRERKTADRSEWRGPVRRYDLAREAIAATAVVAALMFALAGVLSSPDVRPLTIKKWATAAPGDFVATTAAELAGASKTARYGPPYNHASGSVQSIFGVSWQRISGVWIPVNAANDFVIKPLSAVAGDDPPLRAAIARWRSAASATRAAWASAYLRATRKLTIRPDGTPRVPAAADGPIPALVAAELRIARSGGLDAGLVSRHAFYGTDFTKSLLFLEDGRYFVSKAKAQRLLGTQWGVMNETGSYPGQPWLWLYQLWYHVPGLSTSRSVDLAAIYLTLAATVLLTLVPFIPGLRSIPRAVPLYRVIWRRYYREAEGIQGRPPGAAGTRGVGGTPRVGGTPGVGGPPAVGGTTGVGGP